MGTIHTHTKKKNDPQSRLSFTLGSKAVLGIRSRKMAFFVYIVSKKTETKSESLTAVAMVSSGYRHSHLIAL